MAKTTISKQIDEDLILLPDSRRREHHTRESIMVDDVDLMLHLRATRRSIVYGGDSQGPAFWNRLVSAVNRTPQSSPDSVRSTQTLDSDQKDSIVVGCALKLKDSPSVVTASETTRSSMTSNASSSSGSSTFSIWDRINELSRREKQRKEVYHEIVEKQNELITGRKTPSALPSVRGQPPQQQEHQHQQQQFFFSANSPASAVPPLPRVGRLRRQNSWNGRDSCRDLLQARGSVRAMVEDDFPFEHFHPAMEDESHHEEHGTSAANRADGAVGRYDSALARPKQNKAGMRQEQAVLSLIA